MDRFFRKFVITLTIVTIYNCEGWIIVEEDTKFCQTSNGQTGKCVPFKQCLPFVKALLSAKNYFNLSFKENQYFCSYSKGQVNVCCPNKKLNIKNSSKRKVSIYGLYEEENDIPDSLLNDIIHKNLYLLPSECGYLNSNVNVYKILNGDTAFINEFPWMALLSYKTNSGPQFRCGATIINQNYVLTAAHCIKNKKLLGVRVGEYDIKKKIDCGEQIDGTPTCTPGIQDLAIEQLIIHPKFNETTMVNDIALIRVAKMNLNYANAKPVCLPQGDLMNSVLKSVTVTGWGITATGRTANILQKVQLKVVSLQKCKHFYKKKSLTYKQVCAGSEEIKDVCSGDSGGPLYTESFFNGASRYIQHGIVSFGHRKCGLKGFPGVYTRVAYYMDWILDNIKP